MVKKYISLFLHHHYYQMCVLFLKISCTNIFNYFDRIIIITSKWTTDTRPKPADVKCTFCNLPMLHTTHTHSQFISVFINLTTMTMLVGDKDVACML